MTYRALNISMTGGYQHLHIVVNERCRKREYDVLVGDLRVSPHAIAHMIELFGITESAIARLSNDHLKALITLMWHRIDERQEMAYVDWDMAGEGGGGNG